MEANYCSFCGKHRDEVVKVVSGPGVGICNECHDVMRSMMPEPPPPPSAEELARRGKEFDEWMAANGVPPQSS